MMADFKTAYEAIVPKNEGLYSNSASDSGGETVLGLTRRYDADWSGWDIINEYRRKANFPDNLKCVLPVLTDSALSYYKAKYWDVLSLDKVNNQRIATKLFDVSINMGSGIAALFLQRSLNVLNRRGKDYSDLTLDGNIGPKTITAVNNHKAPDNVLLCINALQGARYISICEANPSQEDFMNGWIQRTKS